MNRTPTRHISVVAMSQTLAEAYVPAGSAAMISITDPGAPLARLSPDLTVVLRVSFADATYDDDLIRWFGASWAGSSLGVFRKRHALAVHNFLANLDASVDTLAIHCHAGLSRSAAVAVYASERFGAQCHPSWANYNRTVLEVLKDPGRYEWAWERPRRQSFLERLFRPPS